MTSVDLVSWLLACVFVWAGALNIVGPGFIREEFDTWHYPSWLRLGVGAAEWLAALCLLWPRLRLEGALIGAVVLLGVLATLARQRQFMRLEYPLVLLVLIVYAAAATTGAIGR